MMKGLIMDENMSNLTSASGEISASSGSRTETGTMYPQQSFASTANQAPPTNKKKRSLPGNPDPDAEVIALSPKSLLATNRFICEICNKGFQRDQNLQLHRRGHNLPWKLKQRAKQEVVRKKVYVCPEPTCVHHEPSRALGDLTGIKKHFCRKHGEKKWKCEKCSKRYAVQSDWKAHSKICGTREYRCDCGTIFSRRDSFITHRAFCDALTEESARAMTTANPLLSAHHQPGSSSAASHMINLQCLTVKREQESHLLCNPRPDNINFPPWFACPSVGEAGPGPPPPQHISLSSQLFPTSSLDQSFLQHENPSPNPSSSHSHLPPFQSISSGTASPHMSATALLQKAAQMGVNMSKPSASSAASTSSMLRPHQTHMSAGNSSTAGFSSTSATTSTATAAGSCGLGLPSREDIGGGGFSHHLSSFGNKAAAAVTSSGIMDQMAVAGAGTASLVHDIMSSLSPPGGYGGSSFGESFDGMFNPSGEAAISKSSAHGSRAAAAAAAAPAAAGGLGGGNDGLTRDFLGLKAFPNKNFLNIAGLDHMNSSSIATPTYGGQQHHQSQHHRAPWQG